MGAAALAALVLSTPAWVVPAALPPGLEARRSNNNVALAAHDGRLFLAYRGAPSHFASPKAELVVLASTDSGRTWSHERTLRPGRDVREPLLVPFKGRLLLFHAELGRRPWAFEPGRTAVSERGPSGWTEPALVGGEGEVTWEVKERGGRLWRAAYRGGHYSLGGAPVEVLFQVSDDGRAWRDAPGASGPVYRGGVSEVAFDWDAAGRLWAAGRNEDGDATGFGTLLFTAPPEAPGRWTPEPRSDPERFDSPRLFTLGGRLWLAGRRDLGGPFDRAPRRLPLALRRVWNWLAYWARPKRSALYRLDPEARRFVHARDLPSAGDTAFPSVAPAGDGAVWLANYTSPPEAAAGWTWLRGQLGPTEIYLLRVDLDE